MSLGRYLFQREPNLGLCDYWREPGHRFPSGPSGEPEAFCCFRAFNGLATPRLIEKAIEHFKRQKRRIVRVGADTLFVYKNRGLTVVVRVEFNESHVVIRQTSPAALTER